MIRIELKKQRKATSILPAKKIRQVQYIYGIFISLLRVNKVSVSVYSQRRLRSTVIYDSSVISRVLVTESHLSKPITIQNTYKVLEIN